MQVSIKTIFKNLKTSISLIICKNIEKVIYVSQHRIKTTEKHYPRKKIEQSFLTRSLLHRGKAALRKHLREHDQRSVLSNQIRKSRVKPRVSKN